MAKIHLEERSGIEIRYVNGQDGIRMYLLPNVPVDVGEIQTERGFDLEDALKEFPTTKHNRVRKIEEMYEGRQLDALSVLLYAEEKERFEEFAERLEAKPKDFEYIHPGLMMARTDVTAFFIRLYADLGIVPQEVAERAERQLRDYGVGVIVYPKK